MIFHSFITFLPSALKNSTGDFILNGKKVVDSASVKIKAAGTIIEYSGSDTITEKINSSGPIADTLTLLVCYTFWSQHQGCGRSFVIILSVCCLRI